MAVDVVSIAQLANLAGIVALRLIKFVQNPLVVPVEIQNTI